MAFSRFVFICGSIDSCLSFQISILKQSLILHTLHFCSLLDVLPMQLTFGNPPPKTISSNLSNHLWMPVSVFHYYCKCVLLNPHNCTYKLSTSNFRWITPYVVNNCLVFLSWNWATYFFFQLTDVTPSKYWLLELKLNF